MDEARGFTLIEMLLSISIMAVLAGVSLPVYQSYQTQNDVYITAQKTADATRRAESYARSGNGDSAWGVSVSPTAVTLFKGSSYASRDASFDESFTLPSSLTETGGSETVFASQTGVPNAAGSVTFTSSNGATRTVTLTSEGMVGY